jgi:hypothetical protein
MAKHSFFSKTNYKLPPCCLRWIRAVSASAQCLLLFQDRQQSEVERVLWKLGQSASAWLPAVTMEPAQGSAGHLASSEQAAMHVECVNGPALTDVTPEHGQGLQRMHNFGGSSRGSNGRCSPPNATYRIFFIEYTESSFVRGGNQD